MCTFLQPGPSTPTVGGGYGFQMQQERTGCANSIKAMPELLNTSSVHLMRANSHLAAFTVLWCKPGMTQALYLHRCAVKSEETPYKEGAFVYLPS